MTDKHTPGPWEVRMDGSRVFASVKGADGTPVAACGGNAIGHGTRAQQTRDRRIANARLIAAAPDLLDFARSYLNVADEAMAKGPSGRPTLMQLNMLLATARAAIAKAEGRS